MYGKKICVLFIATFAFSESAFVDFLEETGRCSIKDNACQEKLYTASVKHIAPVGIPEKGIPPFDPFVIKDLTVSVVNLFDITMKSGVAKHLKSCVLNRINTTIENYHSTMEITCDVTIKGNYSLSATSPLIKNLLGSADSVRGDGFGQVKIQKMHITFDFDIFLRETDGEVYIDCTYDDTKYKYDFGKVTFDANNIYIADQEVSNQVVSILNNNWEFFATTFGKPFMTVATDIIFEYTHRFFDVTPARFYLLEDLREWLPNSPKKTRKRVFAPIKLPEA
ncbi:hypothetical protein NE865_11004 [Phthorimaea operculella]|nr:hypothetical protein NE865_11004 [Phthorimaea operculella]